LFLALVLAQVHCGKPEKKLPSPVIEIASGAERGASAAGETLPIYIGADGVTVMAGEALLTDANILARAESFHEKNPQGRVLVESHEAALHGRTVRVLDLLKEAQIQDVAVDVQGTPRASR